MAFAEECSCEGAVEVWMQNVVDSMRLGLSAEFKVNGLSINLSLDPCTGCHCNVLWEDAHEIVLISNVPRNNKVSCQESAWIWS